MAANFVIEEVDLDGIPLSVPQGLGMDGGYRLKVVFLQHQSQLLLYLPQGCLAGNLPWFQFSPGKLPQAGAHLQPLAALDQQHPVFVNQRHIGGLFHGDLLPLIPNGVAA